MKIWLDLANSPQVLFFRPILSELQRRGHQTILTTRAYAQTIALADQLGYTHYQIGEHGGRGFLSLAKQNYLRAFTLAQWAKQQQFDLALSHNSYSQVLAARLLGLTAVTLMDYEHQPLNHLCFRLAQRVLIPEPFPQADVIRFGARHKAIRYPGLKEEVYLADFIPNPAYRQQVGLPTDQPLVVVRPPAPWTAYHRFENDLFDQLLTRLTQIPNAYILFLPRIPSQAESLRHLPGLHIADRVYEGPHLLYTADCAISGGGTMNRESAVLGTPTYTVFKGKMGAVDQFLIAQKKMVQLTQLSDFDRVLIERRPLPTTPPTKPGLVSFITDAILAHS